MSQHSVQVKIAADEERANQWRETLSPIVYDGFVPPVSEAKPSDELYLDSMDGVIQAVRQDEPLSASRIVLDLRAFVGNLSPLVIYFSPILYRWLGNELVVILPNEESKTVLSALNDLLRSLELRSKGIRIISCPTCARCRTDLPAIVRSLESELHSIDKPLDIAVMGCEVNGPGEARSADIGIAFGNQKGLLFRNGEKIRTVTLDEAADVLLNEISRI